MLTAPAVAHAAAPSSEIDGFTRYLPLWIFFAIGAGLFLGTNARWVFEALHAFEVRSVNLAIGCLVWLMIFPTMVKVDFSQLGSGVGWTKGLALTLTANWAIKPFSMAALGAVFLGVVFAPWIPAEAAKGYIAGLVLLGAAPCTGMVFVWSRLAGGDATFTAIQVAINDLVLLVAFAPLVALLLGVAEVSIPWTTLGIATGVYVVLPLASGYLARRYCLATGGAEAVDRVAGRFSFLTTAGLLLLVVVLFGLQAETVLRDPVSVALVAVPVTLQAYLMFATVCGWAWVWRLPAAIAAPAALVGASNFFELAVAVAIALFGVDSPAALATVVGLLVEVPVMLTLVRIANASRRRLDARAARPT